MTESSLPEQAPAGLESWRQRLQKTDGVVLGVGTGCVLVAHGWPQDFQDPAASVLLPTAFALILMVQFHMGLGTLAFAALSAWRRRWGMVLGCVPLILLCLAPTAWKFRPRAQAVTKGPSWTVMSTNVLMINRDVEGILGEVRTTDPDVLFVVELAPQWNAALGPLRGQYPHRVQIVREDSFGLALYSKRPLSAQQRYLPLDQGDLPEFRAEVTLGGQRVALYGVHLLPPRTPSYLRPHRRQFGDLLRLLEREELPVILAGDFNFSERSPHHDRLAELGFVDCLEEAGWGRETTWPVHPAFGWLPSLRLDHIYVRGLVPLEARVGEGRGSDHRPVVARVAFLP